ncbi:MAG: LysR family transcriptional regulator [Pseudomonadota bacterium]
MPDLSMLPPGERHFMRNMDWNLFHLFVEIVQSGGISAAARQLNKQQPTISAGLKRLEEHLGVELFKRTSQGVELTSAGRALLPLCQVMVEAARAAPHEVAKAANLLEGVINIRTISSVVSPQFDEALVAFHRAHPGVEIHLEVTPWRQVVKSLRLGDAEVGLACDSAPSEGLCYEPLMREVQQLYCGKGHPLFGRAIGLPSELSEEAFVLTGQDEPEELERFRRRYGLGAKVGGFAENLHEVTRLIELGIGIGFLPTCVAEPMIAAGQIWPLLPDDLLPSYHVYLVTREAASRDTPTEVFIGEVMARLRQRPPDL